MQSAGGSLDVTSTGGGEPGERDKDPDYIEKRGEFRNRFFGHRARRRVAGCVRGWASDGTGVAPKSTFAKREFQVARRA